MTVRVGEFFKVSLAQFVKDSTDYFSTIQEATDCLHDVIKIPTRATAGSAGYDVVTPVDINLEPGQEIKVPTGLKCFIENGWALFAFPKSGLGFKYYTRLANTIGIIDEDYYNNDNNEGHMFVKVRNEGDKPLSIEKGKAICQMVFLPYGITFNDEAGGVRHGGFGSTNA